MQQVTSEADDSALLREQDMNKIKCALLWLQCAWYRDMGI